jgi:hypothetical protein
VPCECGEDRLLISCKPTVTWIHFVPFLKSPVSMRSCRAKSGLCKRGTSRKSP